MNKKVFAILLNYNGTKDTIACIESLEKVNYENLHIVIVDNQSRKEDFKKLEEYLDGKHKLIKASKNGGFAYGNNIGISYALENEAEYVLLINNDTEVKEDFLDILVSEAEDNDNVGIVTGKIMYYGEDKVWFGGGAIDWSRFYGYHLKLEERKEITFSTGCLMLITRKALETVGLLPEEYFMYYEDVDFCAKLQKNNFIIMYNPKSVIYHKVSSASGGEESPFAVKWNTRNRRLFIKKFSKDQDSVKIIKVKLFFYFTRVIVGVKYLLKGRFDKFRALIEGLKMKV